jgi:signal transduction histidine kinase
MRDDLPENCLMEFHLAEKLPDIRADRSQLKQIILHLISNAADALAGEAGVISIETGRQECDREYLDRFQPGEDLLEGSYIYLDVTDTGCGIDEELRDRIFEPFFSTKMARRGMGMPAVLGIIRGHQGAIRITSGPEKGASFRVLFPENPV